MRQHLVPRRGTGRLPVRAAITSLALAVGSCATFGHRESEPRGGRCDFVVYNRTSQALEIRVLRGLSASAVGALNPGELLTESVPCGERRVWVRGVAIPSQVGAPEGVGFVHGWADLVRGERVIVALHWP